MRALSCSEKIDQIMVAKTNQHPHCMGSLRKLKAGDQYSTPTMKMMLTIEIAARMHLKSMLMSLGAVLVQFARIVEIVLLRREQNGNARAIWTSRVRHEFSPAFLEFKNALGNK